MAVKVIYKNAEGKRNGSDVYGNGTTWSVDSSGFLYIRNADGNWEATVAAGSWNHVELEGASND